MEIVTLAQLRQIGEQCKVDAIGATTAEPFTDVLPALQAYYAEGRASGFEHPIAEERIDPRTILPSARSMVSIAVSYVTADTKAARRPKGTRGVVSVYAWGEDYHRVLARKLLQVATALEGIVGRPFHYVSCVDTAPLVDRAVAARAGLGWIGKNCCLITPAHGSWVFLGTLVTDLEIRVEGAEDSLLDGCGDCTLCITACPTGALREPYILDSQQCLSYVTQMKGMVPQKFRTALGRRVWGCDTCQTVCPKNAPSLLGQEESFAPVPELSFPELQHILTLSTRAFRREFGATAAAWRGVQVWRRNALIALGNARDPAAIQAILPFLVDPRSEIRSAAAWALQRIDEPDTYSAVRAAWECEPDESVRAEMAWVNERLSAPSGA